MMEIVEAHEETPERGSLNEDGSVNLGLRRRPDHPLTIEPEARGHSNRLPSPLPLASDLAAYHQSSTHRHNTSNSPNDENRLAPLSSKAAMADRQSSLSPASFLSSARKRSFSPEVGRGVEDGHEGAKRLSSIKSILNPIDYGRRAPNTLPRMDSGDYCLPPLRSPPSTIPSTTSTGTFSSRGHTPTMAAPGGPSNGRDDGGESERLRAERRAALQREADRMREILAAKERELLEFGDD